MAYLTGLDHVQRNLTRLYTGQAAAMAAALDEAVRYVANYAQRHHPWQPDTGATDASTRGDVVRADLTEIVGAISAGMSYDVFLELAHSGRWSWLWPALMACQPPVMAIFAKHGVSEMLQSRVQQLMTINPQQSILPNERGRYRQRDVKRGYRRSGW